MSGNWDRRVGKGESGEGQVWERIEVGFCLSVQSSKNRDI